MSQLCSVTGYVTDGLLTPISGSNIYASPIVDSNIIYNTSTGYYQGLSMFPVKAISGLDGSFSISLTKNALYRIVIRYIGFDEIVLIPTSDTVELWTLVGSHATILETSTGEVIIEPTEASW